VFFVLKLYIKLYSYTTLEYIINHKTDSQTPDEADATFRR